MSSAHRRSFLWMCLEELLVAVRGRTLGEMLQRSGKPLPPPALEALCQVAEAYADGTLTEWPEKTKQAFPRMHGLSHIRRSPRPLKRRLSSKGASFLGGPSARARTSNAASRHRDRDSASSEREMHRLYRPGMRYNLEGEQIDAMPLDSIFS